MPFFSKGSFWLMLLKKDFWEHLSNIDSK